MTLGVEGVTGPALAW